VSNGIRCLLAEVLFEIAIVVASVAILAVSRPMLGVSLTVSVGVAHALHHSENMRELYAEAREKVAGVYVIPPFKQPEAALDVFA